ncbi:hypothetical protein KIN20_005430 [Parelaphostrongylus tenuis]|uniref:Uncharacterized protein n=1 Tax=Parelaphostrongylus tenuis TaxID=148309 RepID=A0AAD5M379_PARTN|nr:hypothetical protein KIN20_005430 [Parelaphostrongylus tenuis]
MAKRALAVGVYQHYKRLENNIDIQNRELIRNAVSSSMKKKGKRPISEDEEYDDFFGDPPSSKRKTVFERMNEEVRSKSCLESKQCSELKTTNHDIAFLGTN